MDTFCIDIGPFAGKVGSDIRSECVYIYVHLFDIYD